MTLSSAFQPAFIPQGGCQLSLLFSELERIDLLLQYYYLAGILKQTQINVNTD
ncbi:hypothetical protein M2407_005226 [Serratia sp. BIGb0234]|uniref:hypothetical protein n=1 Tax=Serratia sp. BIGb0234 TaxID=2940614 RepID=UPI0021679407|nr:hypothetical protein [Serratia sp. BIGb0234]MCS4320852.1 hypothetical protein [Serratia sp. BIGb0234]